MQFVSLDGVSQGPGSPTEDTSDGFDRGGWLVPHIDEAFGRCTSEWLGRADGLLLGHRTYEAFARDWPAMTDPDDPFSERMNGLPKYVVSRTATGDEWSPVTVLRGSPGDAAVAEAVAALKAGDDGELQIHGSTRLGASLLAAGLVDTLHLVVAPTVVGTGRRLLPAPLPALGLRLTRSETTSTGMLLLEYAVAGAAETAEYQGVPT